MNENGILETEEHQYDQISSQTRKNKEQNKGKQNTQNSFIFVARCFTLLNVDRRKKMLK